MKEEIVPRGAGPVLFHALPVVALAAALASALYVPLVGLAPVTSAAGDLVLVATLLSVPTLCLALAGLTTADRFARLGSNRTLTQLFAYEAPFLLALLGPAIVAGSWQITAVVGAAGGRWLMLAQPLGLLVALFGLAGKLELPPLDAPEAETEIVSGAMTEYSGRGLALFQLARSIELVVGLALIAALYLGGVAGPLDFVLKTLVLLGLLALAQALLARTRIDQTVSLWWRGGALVALAQLLIVFVWKGLLP
jgi:NADH-quinone oxidoreductase subunit H